jgi:hypothetical protein
MAQRVDGTLQVRERHVPSFLFGKHGKLRILFPSP